MTVLKEEIKAAAKIISDFLDILPEGDIRPDKIFPVNGSDDYIEAGMVHSELGTSARAVRYCSDKGIPLEVKINTELNNSQIQLKSRDIILDECIMRDGFGNTYQHHKIYSSDIAVIKKALLEIMLEQ